MNPEKGEAEEQNQEQKTKNRKPRIENQEQKTKNRKPRIEVNPEKGEAEEQKTKNRKPKIENQENQVKNTIGGYKEKLLFFDVMKSRKSG